MLFRSHNVSFVSVTQDINTSTSAGRMMLNILMTFAQYEREVIAERIRDKIAGAKKRGKFCGGSPPLGYNTDGNKKLIINTKEAEIIEAVFKRYSELGSVKKVAAELNRQGLRSKSWISKKGKKRGGQEFNTSHIYRILGNYTYIGKVLHKGKVYQGEHEAIVSEELWEKVHAMFKVNMVSTGRSSAYTPLKGLIRCGYCGGSMTPAYTVNKNKRYTYFQCLKDSRRGESCCPLKRVPAGDVEIAVLKQLAAIFKTPTLLVKTYTLAQKAETEKRKILEKRLPELTKLLEAVRKKINAYSNMENQESMNELRLEFKELNQEMLDKSAKLKRIKTKPMEEADVLEALDNIGSIWAELFPGEKQHLMNLMIDNIILWIDNMKMELKTANMTKLLSEIINIHVKERLTL